LCHSRLSIEDLALALNCSESMIRTLLARLYRHLIPIDEKNQLCPNEPVNLDVVPQVRSSFVLDSGLVPTEHRASVRDQQARLLAMEVRRWLCTFEMTDADRQHVIEQAGFLLDKAEFASTDGYVFDTSRAVLDILGIWGPKLFLTGDRDFRTLVARWLASWIHFWIVDPASWNQALDFEYAHFGAKKKAA
jgi:hypothetical protein